MIIYHGSSVVVDNPKILQSERMLDFGAGFYTTSNKEQAVRWAERVAERRQSKNQLLSIYEFDLEAAERDLVIIRFDKPDGNWLDFVCANRSGREVTEPYDMAFGPVADDQVFATVILYEQGLLDRYSAITNLKVQKLYNQILFHTEISLDYCHYMRHIEIGGEKDGKG